ncbi:hypothetical protein AS156_18180 [Bradyrhizobium macuxiense]|uniref:Uncharacterized protein n=1 Tax=Bradyrhizobium macuxiense TaxID=1755647 RepID=A0A120FJ16_9BRAD|nr:hypothetical protein AS156_18180 [Bradyrhizobium macuxiense]
MNHCARCDGLKNDADRCLLLGNRNRRTVHDDRRWIAGITKEMRLLPLQCMQTNIIAHIKLETIQVQLIRRWIPQGS